MLQNDGKQKKKFKKHIPLKKRILDSLLKEASTPSKKKKEIIS